MGCCRMTKVFIYKPDFGFKEYLGSLGFDVVSDIEEADLIQFTGGADVSPFLYGEINYASMNDFSRDVEDCGYFAMASKLDIPMIGVCRGAQFLNVMCGGSMVQDIPSGVHCRDHPIYIKGTSYSMMASSTHHQMMVPSKDGEVLAYAKELGEVDPEVVYYRDHKCMCFQPHPEYGWYDDLTDYYLELIEQMEG